MVKRSPIFATAVAAALVAGALLPAGTGADPLHEQHLDETRPSGPAIVADAVIARPVYVAATAVGAVFFVVAAPFSLAGGNAGDVWDSLVMVPAKNAFQRCLGCTPVQDANLASDRRLANGPLETETQEGEAASN